MARPTDAPLERIPAPALESFGHAALQAVGAPDAEASVVARSLVDADTRGLHSHGLLRLPLYVEAVEAGGIVAGAPMRWVAEAPAVAVLDAAFGFGQVAMSAAVDRATSLARSAGVATVAVRRSTHYGTGALWGAMLAERGLVSVLASNTGPVVAPHGSAEALLGTNPLTIAFPVPGREPLTLDMATSAGAYGKVVAAREQGQPIPDGWAVDARGAPSNDPAAALEGALLPFGGHKGSGLATAIELLAAALAGARFSFEITDIWVDRSSRMGTGHLLAAWDPAAFGDGDAFEKRVRTLVERIAGAHPAPGVDAVRLPGDVEAERVADSRRNGVPVLAQVLAALDDLAGRLGIDPLRPAGASERQP